MPAVLATLRAMGLPPGAAEAVLSAGEELRRRTEEACERGQATCTEHALLLDAADGVRVGEPVVSDERSRAAIGVLLQQMRPGRAYVQLHTHPDSVSLSADDVSILAVIGQIVVLAAIGLDGTWYLVRAGKGQRPVVLVVPAVTIRELDEHKDDVRRDHLRDRARKVLPMIDQAASSTKPVRLRDGVELQVLPFEAETVPAPLDPLINDDRLIAAAVHYRWAHPDLEIRVLTEDVGPRIKARALGLQPLALPPGLRRQATARVTTSAGSPG